MSKSVLPFERGNTASDSGRAGITLDATSYLEHCGNEYEVEDTTHGTGKPITLVALKNSSGGALTVAREFVAFLTTAALDYGRKSSGFNTAAGGVVLALCDQYVVGNTIAANDVFYAVKKGPCYVNTESSAVSLSAGDAVASDNSGQVNGAVAAAGEFVAGAIDADAAATDTAVIIHMDADLAKPPAA